MNRLPYAAALTIAFILQAACIGWAVTERERYLTSGTEVTLDVVPVDPRDLLRGEYVILSYEISMLSPGDLPGETSFEAGDTIYVSLAPQNATWNATGIHAAPPGGVHISGRVAGVAPPVAGCDDDCGTRFTIDYGIDRFFVPEGQGRDLERLRNNQHLSVGVILSEDGTAALKTLYVDGEPRHHASFF